MKPLKLLSVLWRQGLIKLLIVGALIIGASSASAYFMNRPDGALDHLKEGTFQPDLGPYRTKLDAKYLDRRWVTQEAMALANEMFFIGQTGLNDLVRYALPIAHKSAFQWTVHQESYWYARYNMGSTLGSAHMGINMVQGPYWTLKSIEYADKDKVNRDRGERIPSNKETMMRYVMPLYWKRLGIPRPFDDAQPAYLMFESGDPHLTAAPIPSDTYYDPQSLKRGNWGTPEYFWNTRYARWNQDSQVRFINMGAEGMTMKRGSMWIAYMFKATHGGRSLSSQGYQEDAAKVRSKTLGLEEEISYLGNDPEEAFRGMILVTSNANRLLAWKGQLVADEDGTLGGINPYDYDPVNGLRYWPHRLWPNMLLGGDLPERQVAFDIADPRSLLFDQSAMLLGVTEYYHQTYRQKEVFTANPPVDGGLVERDLGVVARGVANMIVKNLLAMHQKKGLLVSEWQPKATKWWVKFGGAGSLAYDVPDNGNGSGGTAAWLRDPHPGPGETFSLRDAAYAVKGLFEYVDRMRAPLGNPNNPDNPDLEPELTKKALAMLTAQADFLLKMQGNDGSFCAGYNVLTNACVGERRTSEPQFWAIAALSSAYHATADGKYMEAARKAWNYVNQEYWHEPTGLFRTSLGDDTIIVTPVSVAAQVWAYREMLFNNPAHIVEPLIDRWARWWVQTVDMTNLIQAEENRTGELCHGVCSRDFDNDGIPWMGKGHGTYGTAPVFGSKIAVNIGGPSNLAFADLKGEIIDTDAWGGKVVYGYQPKSHEEALKDVFLPVKLDVLFDVDGFPRAPWVARDKAIRFDGVTYPVPPAIPFKRGSEFTGRQIVEMNCAHCHGYTGEGITGIPWDADSLRRTRDDMFEVPKNGRFTRLMPEWGRGLGDEMGAVLTDDEIYRIVDYVQSKEFQRRVYEDYNGIVHPDMPPKDAYFYISLSYLHGKKTPATQEDIRLIMDAQEQAMREHRAIDVFALLRKAEQGRPQESSDNMNPFQWVWRVIMGTYERAAVKEPYKPYPSFFDLLSYRSTDNKGDAFQFHNVRELTASSGGEESRPEEKPPQTSQEHATRGGSHGQVNPPSVSPSIGEVGSPRNGKI